MRCCRRVNLFEDQQQELEGELMVRKVRVVVANQDLRQAQGQDDARAEWELMVGKVRVVVANQDPRDPSPSTSSGSG